MSLRRSTEPRLSCDGANHALNASPLNDPCLPYLILQALSRVGFFDATQLKNAGVTALTVEQVRASVLPSKIPSASASNTKRAGVAASGTPDATRSRTVGRTYNHRRA